MRKESPHLDFEKAKRDQRNHTYQLVDGIKTITLEYIAIEEEKESEDKKAKPKKSIKKSKTWDKEKEEAPEEDKKKKIKKIPNYVRVALTLWDNQKKSSETFTVVVPIVSQPLPPQKKKKKKEVKPPQPKTDTKPAAKKGKQESALDFTLSLIQGPK